MYNAFDLPPRGKCDRKMFFCNGATVAAAGWQTWYKPPGCEMIYMWGCSGGAGGGGGFTGVSAADRAGGGGGGCAGVVRLLIPAIMVPDILYIMPGEGGLGRSSGGGVGASGGISYVSAGPMPAGGTIASMTVDNALYLMSNAAGPTGGGTGTGTTAGAAGGAGTIAVIGSQNRGGYAAHWFATVGLVGYIGGAVADGAGANATVVLGDGVPLSGGAGGSGSTGANVAGGSIAPGTAGLIPTLTGGTAANPNAPDGISSFNPLMSCGGAGGAAIDAAAGGMGGAGGFGSGGGGGGAGTTGGKGGDGGSGLVMIIAW